MVTLSVNSGGAAHLHLATPAATDAHLGTRPSPEIVAGAVIHTQTVPSSEWRGTHQFARMPDVTCYVDGEQVDTDINATTSTYLITWPVPTAGLAIIR
jgi:hypothetical protein